MAKWLNCFIVETLFNASKHNMNTAYAIQHFNHASIKQLSKN